MFWQWQLTYLALIIRVYSYKKDHHVNCIVAHWPDERCLSHWIFLYQATFWMTASLAIQQAFSKPCPVNLISKHTHLLICIYTYKMYAKGTYKLKSKWLRQGNAKFTDFRPAYEEVANATSRDTNNGSYNKQ